MCSNGLKGLCSGAGCDAERYITIEYELDSMIHHLSRVKPVVAVGDGIIMGGGAGVFQGAGM
jgi:enoyl-CoA hydratase/carnithine racemase